MPDNTVAEKQPRGKKAEESDSPKIEKVNRREFLNFAWLISIGFLMVDIAGITFLFALPRFREGEFGGVFTIGTVGELPPIGPTPTNFPKVKIWFSNTDAGMKALYKVCTHLGCLYNWQEQETRFICPCHGSEFEPDGDYILGPAPRDLDQFVVIVETPDGQVIAETDQQTGDAVPVPDDPSAIIKVDTGRKIIGDSHA
jgi:cytochrome b6-f complex iron-sulfur subunit